jgi:DNA invertase Pin-like site-specific DNA recombinase
MRFAFLGRTSDEDAQDPSLSIPRQLNSCEAVVKPLGDKVVAHYWEVESGRKGLESRGNGGGDWSDFNVPVPRDGGIKELIRDAATARFDAVIVESIDRVSRMTADSTRVEQELERLGVALFAADEPMNTNATSILTRRVKQGIAEWYVRDLMEKSRRGMEESVRQGWHTGGRPPYGYMLEEHPHPNPSKAREGKHKHRLVIDPRRAPVVLMIFEDYCVRLLGLGEICDKLNRSPGLYPPPIPNRKDESALPHTWSRSVLNALLRNPKYTGFNVWGRNDKRAGRPQIRPREEWVWSPTPTHPPIITRELFDMVEERAQRNANAAKAGRSRAAHRRPKPQARRLYPLRGRVRCGMCGHRMEGSHQKGSNWYRCQYVYRRGAAAATLAGHPKVHGIKEDKILGPILDFLARRVFGPERLRLLRDELAQATASTWQEHSSEVERLESELQKINRSLRAQTLRLEEHEDPHHPIVALASERIVELSAHKAALTDELDRLKAKRPAGHHPDEIMAMLDTLPDLRTTLATATEAELADIFRAFDVEITYDKDRQILNLAATITPGLLPNFDPDENDRPEGRSQINDIAGAGSVRISPTTATSYASGRTKSQKCASSHEQADFQPFGPRDTSGRMPRAPA